MAVPKRKTSRSRRRKRIASNSVLTLPNVQDCEQCGEPKQAHRVCPSCGFYKGRQIIQVKNQF
ncbi:MAG: 50S ribosomal protein L32 [Verrucomicrobiota bacterium]|nr:50S ribosomal protein L32 [Verrucomicrobiota bacterium]MEE2715141.1 50S ribosomal protein L32 [Verrucomicrobiota bacterium]MEE2813415.1 50S ribosomal protein L32 [Verrucomicrobiota bacterium]